MGDIMGDWVAKVQAERDARVEVLPPVETAQEERDRREGEQRTEATLVSDLMDNAAEATVVQTKLIRHIVAQMDEGKIHMRDLPGVLRGISDVQAKAVDSFLKLTGRSAQGIESDTVSLMRGLARDGLLKVNVELEIGAPESGRLDEP
jgi:hypothetical protein